MALFGNLFGGRKESKKKEEWEKETSFMIAIPKNGEDADNFAILTERLKTSDYVTLKDSKQTENGHVLSVASGDLE